MFKGKNVIQSFPFDTLPFFVLSPECCGMKTQIEHEVVTGDKLTTNFGDKAAVAKLVGVSRRTVDNFIRAGCPHLKIGSRRVRFDLNEVRDWLKQQFHVQRRSG
jgi:excisionase family DNA binding protein